jgi:hypothetical protein
MALYGKSPLEETWDLDPVLLIQMSGWDLPSRVMEQRYMNMFFYTPMTPSLLELDLDQSWGKRFARAWCQTWVEVWLVLCELSLSHPSVDVYSHMCWKWMLTDMVWPLQSAEWMEGLWPNRFLQYVWLQWMFTLIVSPLLSTTSTRAEVWLVLCEMCLSHPSVDVFSMTPTCVGSGC